MKRLKAADLFCGGGGAAMGIHRAGFEVTGWDIQERLNYPFERYVANALEADLAGFDFVWASPPCQNSSRMSGCRPGLAAQYEQLIPATRAKLQAWGGPYIIENVMGSPLINPIMLCGAMFGLQTYRHRLFESNVTLIAPNHPQHKVPASKAGHWKPGTYISIAGNCAPIEMACAAMEIDWMTRRELAEAIPPIFAEHLARQIMAFIR